MGRRAILLFGAVALCLLAHRPVYAIASDYVLIVHPSHPVSEVTRAQVREIYLGYRSQWTDWTRVEKCTQSESPVHEQFLWAIVGRTPSQYLHFWRKAIFTGGGIPPVNLRSDGEVKAYVAARPGGIGYISAESVDGTVKVLKVR